MANQMQQSIKSCAHYLQHEGKLPEVPLHPVVVTALMDLLHVDFTSILTTLKLNRPSYICDPNQTAKTVTKFLYPGLHLNLWDPSQVPE